MPANNIIELGFSPDVVQEKGKIIEALNEVYKSAKKIDGLRIEIKMSDSLKEFRKVVKDLEDQYAELTKTIKDYNQVLEEHFKQQQKAAEAQKKEAQAAAAAAEANQQQAKSVKDVNAAYGSMLGNIEGNIKALNELKATLRQNAQDQKNLNLAYQSGKISLEDYNNQILNLQKDEKLLGQSIRQMNLYITSQAKELIATEDSYDQLNAKLLQLERTWKTLSKTDRESQIGVDLQKEVFAARAELTKLDETIGNHQRKVGNYAGAWNGLGNSVNQLTRELPAFANSLQTGFMGISNNIPILADEIKRIRVENAALRAEGKPTVSVLKQLSTAFFSWGTALSLGVTLLTIYGKDIVEWVKNMISGKDAIDQLKMSQEALNKALKATEYKQAVVNVAELTEKIKLAKEGVLDKKQVLKEYNDTIGKTTGNVENLKDAEKELEKNKDAYIQMMAQKAAATYAYSQYAEAAFEAEQERKKLAESGGSLDVIGSMKYAAQFILNGFNMKKSVVDFAKTVTNGYNEANKKAKTSLDIGNEFMKKYAEILKTIGKPAPAPKTSNSVFNKGIEAQKKANEARLQQAATVNKALSEQESLGYAARQGFLKKYFEVQQQIIAENAAYELKRAGITNDEKLAIQEEAASKSLALTAKYLADNAKLQEKADADEKAQYLKDKEDMKSFEQKHGKELNILKFKQRDDDARQELANGQSRLQDLTTRYNNEQAALTESLNKKEISQAEYAQKMLQSQREYTAEAIKIQLAAAEQAAKLTTDPQQFLDLQNKISGLKKAYQDFVEKTKKDPPKWQTWAKEMQDDVQAVAEMFDNLASSMQSVAGIYFDNQKTELDELGQKADDNYAKEQENIANSILSEEEKANKLKVLEARHDAQKQQIEKRQKQADNERAQFNKQLSIVNIITSTAEAIMKTLAQGGWFALPLTYTIAAMGAAELAAVVATKVPQYAEGTDNHPGGPAIVGEGKHKELVMTPDGKVSIVNKPMLLDLPQHSQVVPITPELIQREYDHQWQQLFQMAKIRKDDYAELTYRQLKQLTKTMERKSEGKTHVHNNIKVDLGWWEYSQRNLRGL